MDTIKKHNTNLISKLLLVTVIMVAVMLTAKLNKSYAAECTVDNIKYVYETDSNGNAINVTIDGTNSTRKNIIYIPDQLDGHTVVSLGKGDRFVTGSTSGYIISAACTIADKEPMTEEFINGTDLVTRFVIPEHVTRINDNAFKWMLVDRANFENLEYIGDNAFDSCVIVNRIFTPWVMNLSSATHIGNDAFAINAPNSPVVLGEFARSMNSYTEVQFSSGLTEIGDNAFKGVGRLRKVTIPTTIAKVGNYAFSDCTQLDHLVIDTRSSELDIGDYAFSGTAIESINIPAIWILGNGIFSNCKSLEAATIETGRTVIPQSTFSGSTLSDVTLPATITEIGGAAFNETNISTAEYNEIFTTCTIEKIGDRAFSRTPLTGEIVVPSSVTSFGSAVFEGCAQMETAKIQINDLTELPNSTFKNCKSLTTVEIPAEVVKLKSEAFENCESLSKEMVLGNILTATKPSMIIEDKVFKNCTGIEGALRIPLNVTTIGKEAFKECTGLTGELQLIDGALTEIGDGAFEDCLNVEKIVIRDSSLSKIGGKAFYNTAVEQEEVFIDAPVTEIGSLAFTNPVDVIVNAEENNVTQGYRWYGLGNPFVHWNPFTHHRIDVINYIPGVKVLNATTNEEIEEHTTAKCMDDFTIKVNKGTYTGDMVIKVVSRGKYTNSDEVVETITLDENNTYKFEHLLRDKKIIIERAEEGTDLVLRTFVTKYDDRNSSSRIPVIKNVAENDQVTRFEYQHDKTPVLTKKGQKLTFTVRVYNQGNAVGTADEIKVTLPDKLRVTNDPVNTTFGWTVSEDGNTATTAYLSDKSIAALKKNGKPEYEDVEIVCEVQEATENDECSTLIAEISAGNDNNSIPNNSADWNITLPYVSDLPRYAYVKCADDDTDFETIKLNGQNKNDFNLVITKLDKSTRELLDGAKMRLYDADFNEIKTVITQNGAADFGTFTARGEGTDTYYLEEIETPVGYKRTVNGKIQLKVIKTLEEGELKVTIVCDLNEIEDPEEETDVEYIPVSTAEQLTKIGSGEEITINDRNYTFGTSANYKIMNDIDLTGIAWKPIAMVDGIFDGNGKTISNMQISDSNTYGGITGYGMFISYSGTIKDLTLSVRLANDVQNPIAGTGTNNDKAMGGIAASMGQGRLKNCKVMFATSASYGANENVGGLIGYTVPGSVVRIENCDVTFVRNNDGATQNIGGLIGKVGGNVQIADSINQGPQLVGTTGIGGFVGFSERGSLVEVQSSTNRMSIQSDENGGGIIGTALGGLDIKGCNNVADVIGKVGMGGLVGYVEPSEYTPKNMKIVYENGTFNIFLTNKEKIDTFKINVLKVNEENNVRTKLDGAKFNIYKKVVDEVVLVKENAVTENGYISIENLQISSLTNDVYYIKEVQAPNGYDKVVNEDIKVHMTVEWDGVNEKFIINPELSVVEDMDTDTVDPVDSNKGDPVTIPASDVNVKWKTSKAHVSGSYNTANVIGWKNVGGIIGCTKGYAIVEDCHNKLNTAGNNKIQGIAHSYISGNDLSGYNGNIGGIVGCTTANDKDETVEITGCSNETLVSGFYESKKAENVGGILGANWALTEVNNSTNTGKIEGERCAGGIVGTTLSNIKVDSCKNMNKNKDTITEISSTCAGGMIGAMGYRDYVMEVLGFVPYYDLIEITNCTTTGSTINGQDEAGAMIAYGGPFTIRFVNCTAKNNTIVANASDGCAGGLMGNFANETIEAIGNTVETCTIQGGESGNGSGIVGVPNPYAKGDINDTLYPVKISWNLEDCHVNGCTISAGKEAVGMIATGTFFKASDESTSIANIINCSVGKDANGTRTTLSGRAPAGIIGASLNETCHDWTIKDVTVSDTDMVTTTDYSDGGIGGIVGYQQMYSAKNKGMDFINCKVKNVTMSGNKSGDCVIGGIMAGFTETASMPNYESSLTVKFDNCEIDNLEVRNAYSDFGGMVAEYYLSGSTTNVEITNCHAKDMTVYGNGSNENAGIGGLHGTCMGYGQQNVLIDNSVVEHLVVNTGARIVGGIFAHHYGHYGDPNNKVKISNSKVIGKTTSEGIIPSEFNGGTIVGGLLGGTFSDGYNTIFENVEVSDLNINNSIDFAGGAVGEGACSDTTFNGMKLKNIKINNTAAKEVGGIAGILGRCYGMENVEVSNIEIKTDGRAAAGIANELGEISMRNATFKDIDVDTSNGQAVGGIFGNSTTSCGYYTSFASEFKDIKLENVNIKGNSLWAGLFAGTLHQGCDISDIEIKNSSVEDTYSSAICIGGFIGCNYPMYKTNSTVIKNIKMTDTTIKTGDNAHVGGVVGFTEGSQDRLIIDGGKFDNTTITRTYTTPDKTTITAGILALSGLTTSVGYANISNVEVNNLVANGNGSVGGIYGEAKCRLNNVKVTNPKITATTENARAGAVAAIAETESVAENITVTADANNTAYGVFSDYLAGGFAAICSGKVSDTTIENIIVKTSKEVKAAPASTDTEATANQGDSWFPAADARVARYGSNLFEAIVSNVKLIIGTQEQIVNE